MASTQKGIAVNLVAGEDLNGDFAEVVAVNSSGRVIKTTAATDVIVGVVAEDPGRTTVDGEDRVPIALIGGGGVLKMKAGATINAGDIIVPDTDAGRVAGVANIAALVANQMGVGYALEAAVDGDIFEVLVMSVSGPTA